MRGSNKPLPNLRCGVQKVQDMINACCMRMRYKRGAGGRVQGVVQATCSKTDRSTYSEWDLPTWPNGDRIAPKAR